MAYNTLDHDDVRVLRVQANMPVNQGIMPRTQVFADNNMDLPHLKNNGSTHVNRSRMMGAPDDFELPIRNPCDAARYGHRPTVDVILFPPEA